MSIKPFRFMASWLVDRSFQDVVKEEDFDSWHDAVGQFQIKASDWNHNCFGNIFHKKRQILARLEGINAQLDMEKN